MHWKLAAAAAAMLLASCGGGGSGPSLGGLVSFGDSLSDVGTYRVGTVAAVGGGQFTVNGAAPTNWTEFLARNIGLPAPCAAQTGLLPNIPGFTGAAVTNHPDCTNYAQGSSRVTLPLGPNSAGLQAAPFSQQTLGLMAIPVATQVANHLTAHGGFTGNEIVTVLAGGNDLFMQFGALAAASGGGAAAVGAALAAGWPTATQNAVAAGGAAAVNAAITAAVTGMGTAGAELAALVRNQIMGKGARFVVVVNLPDVSITPFGLSLTADQRSLMVTMVTTFNGQLKAGLGSANVIYVDAFTTGQAQAANPTIYGFTNTTSPACNPLAPQNPLQGSSLACTAASTYPTSTFYQYADSVHPTPYAHSLIANTVSSMMHAAGWI